MVRSHLVKSATPGMIVTGLGASIVLWTLWFLTHVPWIGLPEHVSLPVLLVAWVTGTAILCRGLSRAQAVVTGLGGGIVSATVGLLLVGSKLRPPPAVEGQIDPVIPSAHWISIGFLATGAAVGLIGGLLAVLLTTHQTKSPDDHWAARMASVAMLAALPLVFIGGLVTSTASGMAVPDWPNTFGTNMFLYPLGPRSDPAVFFEHSHRLFGTLLGLTSIVLALWYAWRSLPRPPGRFAPLVLIPGMVAAFYLIRKGFVDEGFLTFITSIGVLAGVVGWKGERAARPFALFALLMLAFVVVQGWLGGRRVSEASRALALLHGVSAQLLFAALAGLATTISPSYATLAPGRASEVQARRLRFLATGTLHALILQLLLGAAYRHLEHKHILWSHAAFAAVVLVFATLAGLIGAAFRKEHDETCRVLRRTGYAVAVLVAVQFLIGWVAFMGTGQRHGEASRFMTLVRTTHQTNGALLLAAVTSLWLMGRRVCASRPSVELLPRQAPWS
jgi:cytochrome c oxidase assembly protein subunit 15